MTNNGNPKNKIPKLPVNVESNLDRLHTNKLLVLMKQAHCLVFSSKGEGFGLPPREAMSTGIPIILAGFAGLEPIANPNISYPLQWKFEKASGYDAYKFHWSEGWYKENQGCGDWAFVEEEELARVMRSVVQNVTLAQEKGKLASEWIRKHETIHHSAQRIVECIDLKCKKHIYE